MRSVIADVVPWYKQTQGTNVCYGAARPSRRAAVQGAARRYHRPTTCYPPATCYAPVCYPYLSLSY
eukprot:2125751-Rhodomonas_salina.1